MIGRMTEMFEADMKRKERLQKPDHPLNQATAEVDRSWRWTLVMVAIVVACAYGVVHIDEIRAYFGGVK